MPILSLESFAPEIHASAWVAPTATVIGRVHVGAESSIWYGSVVRGDNDEVHIGARSNVQDACVLHTDPGFPLRLGDGVSVGHQVMLHGCTVGDGSLIGIQAVLLNGSRIGRRCLVGAGSLVTEGKEFPDGSLIMGTPARVMRALTDEELQRLATASAAYMRQSARHRGARVVGA